MQLRCEKDNHMVVYVKFTDGTEFTDADATPTVAAERNGTALTAPGLASVVDSPGEYMITLVDEHVDTIGTVVLTVTGAVGGLTVVQKVHVRVVGSRMFPLYALRAFPALSNVRDYPDIYLERVRTEVEEAIEDFCNVSFTGVYGSDWFRASDYSRNNLDAYSDPVIQARDRYAGYFLRQTPVQSLTAVTVAGTAATLSDWVVNAEGQARSIAPPIPDSSVMGEEVNIEYVHGFEYAPADLVRVAVRWARDLALKNSSTVPDRARLMQTEFGLFVMDMPGKDKLSGNPELDAVFCRRRREDVGSFA